MDGQDQLLTAAIDLLKIHDESGIFDRSDGGGDSWPSMELADALARLERAVQQHQAGAGVRE